jgi:DNA-binding GntR family transcriptional regulator
MFSENSNHNLPAGEFPAGGETRRANSEEAVHRKLKQAIRKRYIKQGSQLVEVALARQLGVSRTPVRGAIRRLEAEGLVNSIPHRGAFVITPTPREIRETFAVRAELEIMAVRLAAARVSSSDIEELRNLIGGEEEIFASGDIDAYYHANDSLHLRLAELSDNRVLAAAIRDLLDRTRIYLILYDPFYKLGYAPTNEHRAIVDAIANGQISAACQAVKNHLDSAVRELDSAGQLPDDYLTL